MPSLTLTEETLGRLGVAHADLIPALTPNGRRLLQAHMLSRGFDMSPGERALSRCRLPPRRLPAGVNQALQDLGDTAGPDRGDRSQSPGIAW
jgi:hypothetical protein